MKYERLTIRNSDGSVSQPTHSTFEKVFNRLAELEDDIESGKIVRLPCPIHTMVYYIVRYKKNIGFCGKWKHCYSITEIPFEFDMLDSYGNNWFLTREEAEARLKELKNK